MARAVARARCGRSVSHPGRPVPWTLRRDRPWTPLRRGSGLSGHGPESRRVGGCSHMPREQRCYARLLDQADAAARHEFTFFDLRRRHLGNPVAWNFEPKAGKPTPTRFAPSIDYRDYAEVGDCKLVWEPNRHHQLVVLGRAFRASGDGRYARGGRRAVGVVARSVPVRARHELAQSAGARRPADQLGLGARFDPRVGPRRRAIPRARVPHQLSARLGDYPEALARHVGQQPSDGRARRASTSPRRISRSSRIAPSGARWPGSAARAAVHRARRGRWRMG